MTTAAADIAEARRLDRQQLLAQVDEHPWSVRVDQRIDACVAAFDRDDGLAAVLHHLHTEVGLIRGELVAAFPPTLGEPALAAMAAVQRLGPLIGALMDVALVAGRAGQSPMFRTLLVRVLTEVSRETRRAVLQLDVARRCELTPQAIRRALEG